MTAFPRPARARRRGMTCSSSMSLSSRGTPGVKKNRALPMSSAKPQAVPIGLSSSSAVAGNMACLRLLGGMARLRRRKNSSIRPTHSGWRTRATPAAWAAISCDRSSTVGPSPPFTITASARVPGEPERLEQALPIVADGGLPPDGEPDVLEPLAHVAEVGIDDLARQDLVARADDLDVHGRLSPGSSPRAASGGRPGPRPAVAPRGPPRGAGRRPRAEACRCGRGSTGRPTTRAGSPRRRG